MLAQVDIYKWLSSTQRRNFDKVAICGTARTGTTLMQQMMRTFENVLVIPSEVPSKVVPSLATFADVVVVTKRPDDIQIISETLEVWPNTLFIIMKRDPRDIMCSRMSDGGYAYGGDAEKILWYMGSNLILEREYQKDHAANITTVRYEDLVRKPNTIQRELAKLIGLKITYKFNRFYELPNIPRVNQVIYPRPVSRRSVGQWRRKEHRDWMREILLNEDTRELLCYFAIEEGYIEDDDWVEEIL